MTALWYNGTRALARFLVAVAGLGCKQAIDKYTPQWLLLTVVALLLAIALFVLEQRLKHLLAD